MKLNKETQDLIDKVEEETIAIKEALDKSSKVGMEIEVMYSLINAVRRNPQIEIKQVLQQIMENWDI